MRKEPPEQVPVLCFVPRVTPLFANFLPTPALAEYKTGFNNQQHIDFAVGNGHETGGRSAASSTSN